MASKGLSGPANNLIDCSDGKKRHFVLFYENEKSALNVMCEFIKSGLKRGEYCTLSTDKSVGTIERELTDAGIDVDRFRKRNMLDIHKMSWPREEGEVKYDLEREEEFLRQKPGLPKRIVGVYATARVLNYNVNSGIAIEQLCKSIFEEVNGSVLCPYPVSKIPLKERARWMMEMLKIHHVAIFVDEKGQTQVIEL